MKNMGRFYISKSKKIYLGTLLCATVALTGCSFGNGKTKSSNNNSNIAYAVPEKVAVDGVDTRRKPTRPVWTEDYVDKEVSSTPKLESTTAVYVVKKGDTLYGIARAMGVSAKELMSLNGMDNNTKLFVGQKIKVPSKKKTEVAAVENVVSKSTATYTVQRGDSLYKIAKIHGMAVNDLKNLNNMSSDRIYIGQVLQVYDIEVATPKASVSTKPVKEPKSNSPAKPVAAQQAKEKYVDHEFALDSEGFYTIRSGDTLGKIANGFKIDVETLKEANGIDDPKKLQIGKKLIIPHASGNSSVVVTKGNVESIPQPAPKQVVREVSETKPVQPMPETKETDMKGSSDDFFENFDEIPVVEINN